MKRDQILKTLRSEEERRRFLQEWNKPRKLTYRQYDYSKYNFQSHRMDDALQWPEAEYPETIKKSGDDRNFITENADQYRTFLMHQPGETPDLDQDLYLENQEPNQDLDEAEADLGPIESKAPQSKK